MRHVDSVRSYFPRRDIVRMRSAVPVPVHGTEFRIADRPKPQRMRERYVRLAVNLKPS